MEEVLKIHEVANNSEFQLDDDYSLLDLMIKDMETSDILYQPTTYWKKYTAEAVELLRKAGLRDFRRSEERVLSSFGCLDKIPELHFSAFLKSSKNLPEGSLEQIDPFMEFANSLWEQDVPVGPGGLTVSNFFFYV